MTVPMVSLLPSAKQAALDSATPWPIRSQRRFPAGAAVRLPSAAVAPNDTPMVPVKGQSGLAFLVVLAIAGVALLIIIVSAFSQDNARTSVTGDKATYSHNLP